MRIVLIIAIIVCSSSCKSLKQTQSKVSHGVSISQKKTSKTTKRAEVLARKISDYAQSFKGVKYRWGGTTRRGMDCSGLIFKAFQRYGVALPRVSREMAQSGRKIPLRTVREGDLLFFKTSKRKRHVVNHVGLVLSTSKGQINFIHATSSRGVKISSLTASYWRNAFFQARRYL